MHSKKFWSLSVVFAVSLTRIGYGLFCSLSGPTLLYLANNVSSSVDAVSYILSSRAVGNLIGAIFGGFLIRYCKKYKPLVTIGIGVVIGGVLMLVTPWIYSLSILIVVNIVIGLLFGYLDSGAQSMYLNLWGEKDSRPYIQSFHFAYGVGAVLAPIVAAPFLQKADSQAGSDDESCYQQQQANNFTDNPAVNNLTSYDDEFNPVGWTYVMSGAFTLLTGLVMVVLALCKAEKNIKILSLKEGDAKQEKTPEKAEEPLKDVIWLLIPVVFFYFIICSLELVYQSYIYSIALCSDLNFTVSDSAMLNTLFWVGFMTGRGSGIFISNYLRPKTMILFSMIGTTTGLIIFTMFGQATPTLYWVESVFHGFCVAWFYSSGMSWTSQITNVSNTYIFIFMTGNTAGSMITPIIAGLIFISSPFNVVYLLVGLASANVFVTSWMFYSGKRHKIFLKNTNENSNTDEKEDKERFL